VIRPLGLAFGFLTRLPVPASEQPAREEELGASVAFFPLVGLALGLLLAVAGAALTRVLSPLPVAALLVALLAAITGGLHLDGVADVFDGLGGGRGDRERMLAIMRDSRIGAHGATALALVLGLKIFALAELLQAGAPLWFAPVVSRWAVGPLIFAFPYARPAGLGRAFSGSVRPVHLLLSSLTLAAVLAFAGPGALLPAGVAAAVALGLALWIRRHLGGLTGDVYGAAIELSELACWVVAGAHLRA
jgi:adenosylcobinamide-GDP ribazoletransferase